MSLLIAQEYLGLALFAIGYRQAERTTHQTQRRTHVIHVRQKIVEPTFPQSFLRRIARQALGP
jgi:hypothetical protein